MDFRTPLSTIIRVVIALSPRASAGAGHGHTHNYGGRKTRRDVVGDKREGRDRGAAGGDGVANTSGGCYGAQSIDGLRRRPISGEGAADVCGNAEVGEDESRELFEASTRRRAMAYLNLAADAVHNFIDGMAIGAAFLRGGAAFGWARTLIILAHELPQEVGDYGLLVSSGMGSTRALAWNFASVRPTADTSPSPPLFLPCIV
jgi:zinc transporter ZupT